VVVLSETPNFSPINLGYQALLGIATDIQLMNFYLNILYSFYENDFYQLRNLLHNIEYIHLNNQTKKRLSLFRRY
jgi:hypothetical protein